MVMSWLEDEVIVVIYCTQSLVWPKLTISLRKRCDLKNQIEKEGMKSFWDELSSLIRLHQAINLGRDERRFDAKSTSPSFPPGWSGNSEHHIVHNCTKHICLRLKGLGILCVYTKSERPGSVRHG